MRLHTLLHPTGSAPLSSTLTLRMPRSPRETMGQAIKTVHVQEYERNEQHKGDWERDQLSAQGYDHSESERDGEHLDMPLFESTGSSMG